MDFYARLRDLAASGEEDRYQETLAELRERQKTEASRMEGVARRRRVLPENVDDALKGLGEYLESDC